MDCETLLQALRRTACDNLRCLGCGHEHNCSLHGCAINRAAAEMIEEQAARITELEQKSEAVRTETEREVAGSFVAAFERAARDVREHYGLP